MAASKRVGQMMTSENECFLASHCPVAQTGIHSLDCLFTIFKEVGHGRSATIEVALNQERGSDG